MRENRRENRRENKRVNKRGRRRNWKVTIQGCTENRKDEKGGQCAEAGGAILRKEQRTLE